MKRPGTPVSRGTFCSCWRVLCLRAQSQPRGHSRRLVSRAFLVLFSLVPLHTAKAQASDCTPVAVLDGDPAMVELVETYLQVRGVSTHLAGDCPSSTATLSVSSAGVSVRLSNSTGRTDTRVVSDASTAAALIESWARSDLITPLLDAERRAPVAPRDAEPRSPVSAMPPSSESLPNHGDSSIRYALGLRPAIALAGDLSTWLNVSATGSVCIGPLCPGVAVRYNVDLGASGHSRDLKTSRHGVEVLVTGEYPIDLGVVTLAPGAGLGAGWTNSKLADRSTGAVELDSGRLRIEGFMRAFFTSASGHMIGATLFVGIDPLAHTTDFEDPDGRVAGNPRWNLGLSADLAFGAL